MTTTRVSTATSASAGASAPISVAPAAAVPGSTTNIEESGIMPAINNGGDDEAKTEESAILPTINNEERRCSDGKANTEDHGIMPVIINNEQGRGDHGKTSVKESATKPAINNGEGRSSDGAANTEDHGIMPAINSEQGQGDHSETNAKESTKKPASKDVEGEGSNGVEGNNGGEGGNEDRGNCAICLETKNEGLIIALRQPCGHSFHRECLQHLVSHQNVLSRCPLCREPISHEQFLWICNFAVRPEHRYDTGPLLPPMPGQQVQLDGGYVGSRGFGLPLLQLPRHHWSHPFEYPGADAVHRSGFPRESRRSFIRDEQYPGDRIGPAIMAPVEIEEAPVLGAAADGMVNVNPLAEEEDYMGDLRRRAAMVRERVQAQLGQQAGEIGQGRVETQTGQQAGEMYRGSRIPRLVGPTAVRHPPVSMTRMAPNHPQDIQVRPESMNRRPRLDHPLPNFYARAPESSMYHHRNLRNFFGVDANFGPDNNFPNEDEDDEDIEVFLRRTDQEVIQQAIYDDLEREEQAAYEAYLAAVIRDRNAQEARDARTHQIHDVHPAFREQQNHEYEYNPY